MTTSMDDLPMIGQVNKNLFWSLLLVALLALTGMVALASRGAIAMAATIPVPFTVQSGTITVPAGGSGPNFALFPGLSPSGGVPVAVSQLKTASITDMVITKQFSFGGHTITMKLSAGGSGSSAVTASDLTLDANSLDLSQAQFSGLTLSSSGIGGLEQDAGSATLTGATINSPYLAANSITLPGLSVSISVS